MSIEVNCFVIEPMRNLVSASFAMFQAIRRHAVGSFVEMPGEVD